MFFGRLNERAADIVVLDDSIAILDFAFRRESKGGRYVKPHVNE